MIISLIGPPCAGKGTQARILQDNYNFKFIGAGDLLRAKAKTDPECQEMLDAGVLVPVEYIWSLMEEAMESEIQTNPNAKILLDGYPRELSQAQLLDKYLTTKSQKIYLINMYVHTKILVERMLARLFCDQCGKTTTAAGSLCCDKPMQKRPDDTIESFEHRLQIFHSNINIIKDFYHNKDTCQWHDIDAGKNLDEVNMEFESLLNNIMI